MTTSAAVACLVAGALGAVSAAAAEPAAGLVVSDRLPLIAEGGTVNASKKEQAELSRSFRLPTRGVWYVWLKVSAKSKAAPILTYHLDGERPFRSARGRIVVPSSARRLWINDTAYPEFRAEVHVWEPGDRTLTIRALHGEAEIERIALTLYCSAKPDGDVLDHRGDPGGGRAFFPDTGRGADGFRRDWVSPPVVADRIWYVDAGGGDDANDGRSPATAWKTFRNVNGRIFEPGDAILLKRGERWTEGLAPGGNGTKERWITLGAYGEGPRPVVDGVNRDAVRLDRQSYWVVQDLELTSDPSYGKCGLAADASFEVQPKGLKVFNVVAYDNGPAGIRVGRHGQDNGWDGVLIENCLAYANDSDGIVVGGSDQTGCRNTVIRFCTAWSNLWGGGIWIHSGQNGLIERCLAYNNACINIWTWNSINVTIRRCEAFRGRHPRDAGGFDIDWGCQACTLEFCYSHHNEGVGILLMGGGKGTYRKHPVASRYNLARYNVSENDNPGLGMVETFDEGYVHNNLVVASGADRRALDVSGWPDDPWASEKISGGWPSNTRYLNNVFIGLAGALPSWIDDRAASRENANTFDHNLYWREGRGPLIRWGGRRNGNRFWYGEPSTDLRDPADYADLATFRKATRHERHGLEADPRFAAPYRGEYGRLPLESYALASDSPVRGRGIRVTLSGAWLRGRAKYLTDTGAEEWGVPMHPAQAAEDYWGNPLPAAGPVSVGARER
jgi:hypothetical protein